LTLLLDRGTIDPDHLHGIPPRVIRLASLSPRQVTRDFFLSTSNDGAGPPCWPPASRRATLEENDLAKPPTPPRTFTVADAHALADRLERNQRPQSDQAMAAKLIRALLAGRATSDVIVMLGE
jgi:hypothetical protein